MVTDIPAQSKLREIIDARKKLNDSRWQAGDRAFCSTADGQVCKCAIVPAFIGDKRREIFNKRHDK